MDHIHANPLLSFLGSGKTAAFLLPLIATLVNDDKRKGRPQGTGFRQTYKAFPLALILAPTRELASQIFDEAKKVIPKHLMRHVVVLFGLLTLTFCCGAVYNWHKVEVSSYLWRN